MIELLFALLIGMIFGYILKTNKPVVNSELHDKVNKLEEEIRYYKDLCKWHTQRNFRVEKDKE